MTPPGQSGSTSVKAGADTASTNLSDMVPQVYAQLRELARQKMAQERDGHTLQTTALVHEAYLRLFGSGRVRFASRQHFFRAAAEAMRRILVEHARGRGRVKRGGRRERVPLDLADAATEMNGHDLLALDDMIEQLGRHSPDGAAIVRLRFYVGLSLDETAEALGVNPRTVDREWKYAKAWLYRRWKEAEP